MVPVVLSGDATQDVAAIRTASGGGADLAFDMIGQAADANAALAALRSLRRVLMGSMQVALPIPYGETLLNNRALIGRFMYTRADYLALVSLATSGQISLDAVELKSYPFAQLEAAIDAAGRMSGLQMHGRGRQVSRGVELSALRCALSRQPVPDGEDANDCDRRAHR